MSRDHAPGPVWRVEPTEPAAALLRFIDANAGELAAVITAALRRGAAPADLVAYAIESPGTPIKVGAALRSDVLPVPVLLLRLLGAVEVARTLATPPPAGVQVFYLCSGPTGPLCAVCTVPAARPPGFPQALA